MLFSYHCLDDDGRARDGLLEAASSECVRAELARRGWKVLSVRSVAGSLPSSPLRAPSSSGSFRPERLATAERPPSRFPTVGPAGQAVGQGKPPPSSGPNVSLKSVSLFTLHLATLVRANVPLHRSLACLSQGEDRAMGQIAGSLLVSVEGGNSLSTGLSAFPQAFSATYVGMIRVGEHSGALVQVLTQLAEFLRVNCDRRGRLMASLTYPLFVALASFAMLAFLALYMLPRLLGVIQRSPADLPWITRAVLAVSSPPVVGVVLTLGASALVWWLTAGRTPAGRLFLAHCLNALPVAGPMLATERLGWITRNLGLMLRSGVSLTAGLNLLLQSNSGSERMDQALAALERQLREGAELSEGLRASGAFPPLLVAMVSAAEAHGHLERAFLDYSRVADEELDSAIEAALALLEPLTLGVLGVTVGTILLAAFMPIYQLLTAVPS